MEKNKFISGTQAARDLGIYFFFTMQLMTRRIITEFLGLIFIIIWIKFNTRDAELYCFKYFLKNFFINSLIPILF